MKKKLAIVTVLVVAFALLLAGCGAPSKEALEEKYKDAGYTVQVSDGMAGATEWQLIATKDSDNVTIIAYSSKALADAAENVAKALGGVGGSVKRKGNVVAIGTTEALKLF
ncbi:MAG: hypothetical protein FWH03_01570 [Firmicutes bacterium]|nr:hypothetical protein [Bacillota bacterium]